MRICCIRVLWIRPACPCLQPPTFADVTNIVSFFAIYVHSNACLGLCAQKKLLNLGQSRFIVLIKGL